jgi:hypothetical protein
VIATIFAMRRRKSSLFTIFFLVAAGLILGGVGTAMAVKPEKKFKGKIIISEKRFPSRFKNDNHFVSHMKKVETHELTAEGDDDWEFEYMAFLPGSLNALSASITYYDITNPGSKDYVNSFKFRPRDKSQQILSGHARLSPDKFSADRKYLMVFARGYGQKPLAKTIFVLRREGNEKENKGDGTVDFTE